MNCTICNDTGKLPGSDYLDCGHCGAAGQRAELDREVRAFFNSYCGDLAHYRTDEQWFIHQRARQIEREEHAEAAKQYKAQIDDLDQQNTALTNECRGMQAEKEAQAARIAELERENARLDAALDGEISCRDHYQEWADKLAAEISRYFGVDIGEHSNVNNPWERAYEAVPAAPAVEQQPLGWLRKWAFDGEKPRKEKGKWVAKFRFLPITQHQAFNDDVPLYAAPQAADTDKVREAVEAMNRAKLLPILDIPLKLHAELDVIFKALSSMAAQSPVREVPEGWKLVPIEPTIEMVTKLVEAWYSQSPHDAYRDILAAAPLPAAPVPKGE